MKPQELRPGQHYYWQLRHWPAQRVTFIELSPFRMNFCEVIDEDGTRRCVHVDDLSLLETD